MKRTAFLIFLIAAGMALGQVQIGSTINFETDGVGYTAVNTGDDGATDYFIRTNNINKVTSYPYSGASGYFWATDDNDEYGEGTVTTTAFNVSGYENLQVKVHVACATTSTIFETDEVCWLEYNLDSGGWTGVVRWNGNYTLGTSNFYEDPNMDGVGEGVMLTPTFTQRTYTIGVTGSSLQLRFRIFLGAGEDFAFDNIQVWGEAGASTPTTQATNVGFANVGTTQMDVSWTRGDGDACCVFVKQGSSGTASPVDNSTYTANTTFGSGTQIGATGWYCVYNGTGTGVTVSGLTLGTAYQVHVCEYNGGAGSELYMITSATDNPDNQTTLTPTVVFVNGANPALDFHQVKADNPLPDADWLCGQFSLTGDVAGATLNSVTVFLDGTYDAGDLASTPFQIYASNINDFSTSSALGSSLADPGSGSDLTFTGLSDAIPASTRYYWVTADISTNATSDDTMNGTVDAAGDLSITSGTISGSSVYGKLNAGSDASLPVTLSLFSARQEGTSVILEWKTESEIDHLGFILERLESDGAWTRIADYQTNPALFGEGSNSTGREYMIEDEDVMEGVYIYRLIEVSIGGDEEEVSRIRIAVDGKPQLTELLPAVPNPFNPSTQIFYELSEESQVRIKIYDVTGRPVKTLLSGKIQRPGSYNIYWNGDDEKGVTVSTGTYFVILDTKDYRKVRKIMMLR